MAEQNGENRARRRGAGHFDDDDAIVEIVERPPVEAIHLTRQRYYGLVSKPDNIIKIVYGRREETQQLFAAEH